MGKHDLDQFGGAYGPDFRFHEENLWMLSWYAERMVRALEARKTRSLVSLGIGHQVVSHAILESLGRGLREYTVVEGSPASIQRFQKSTALPPNARVVNALFEEFEPASPVDAVEMGFVLEHVEDPLLVVRRYARFLRPPGTIIIVVPNARSLHRMLGHAAGLLDDMHRLSPDDLQLGHRRYFDLDSITALVKEAGLRVRNTEGVFLKCLTTAQLQRLELSPEVREAFFKVGVGYPEISNAIYLETSL
jgi:SAM-dependent methyltransferase